MTTRDSLGTVPPGTNSDGQDQTGTRRAYVPEQQPIGRKPDWLQRIADEQRQARAEQAAQPPAPPVFADEPEVGPDGAPIRGLVDTATGQCGCDYAELNRQLCATCKDRMKEATHAQ